MAIDEGLLSAWRRRIDRARGHLGWDLPGVVARIHASGVSLAIAAPCDLLFLATEVNEWAWSASVVEREPERQHALEEAWYAAALDNAVGPEEFWHRSSLKQRRWSGLRGWPNAR